MGVIWPIVARSPPLLLQLLGFIQPRSIIIIAYIVARLFNDVNNGSGGENPYAQAVNLSKEQAFIRCHIRIFDDACMLYSFIGLKAHHAPWRRMSV